MKSLLLHLHIFFREDEVVISALHQRDGVHDQSAQPQFRSLQSVLCDIDVQPRCIYQKVFQQRLAHLEEPGIGTRAIEWIADKKIRGDVVECRAVTVAQVQAEAVIHTPRQETSDRAAEAIRLALGSAGGFHFGVRAGKREGRLVTSVIGAQAELSQLRRHAFDLDIEVVFQRDLDAVVERQHADVRFGSARRRSRGRQPKSQSQSEESHRDQSLCEP